MPKIRFSDLPAGLWQHLLVRVEEGRISLADLRRLQEWVKSEPLAPDGDWYKDFGSFKLCGSGEGFEQVTHRGQTEHGELYFGHRGLEQCLPQSRISLP